MYSTITCNYLSAPFLHWCDVKCGFTFLEKTATNKLLSLNPISCPFASPFEPNPVAFLRLSILQTSDQRRLAIRPAPLQERPLCRCVQITVISCLKWRPLEARRRKKQRGLTCKPTYAHTHTRTVGNTGPTNETSVPEIRPQIPAVWDREAGGGRKKLSSYRQWHEETPTYTQGKRATTRPSVSLPVRINQSAFIYSQGYVQLVWVHAGQSCGRFKPAWIVYTRNKKMVAVGGIL